jgi:ferrous iron transport protein A
MLVQSNNVSNNKHIGGYNMPLSIAPKGVKLRIKKILTEEKIKRHLENLGITVETELTVLSNTGGNSVCIVKGVRLALDFEISKKIFVA